MPGTLRESLICKQLTEYERCQGSLHCDTPYLRINTRRTAEETNFNAWNPEINSDRARRLSSTCRHVWEILEFRSDFGRLIGHAPSDRSELNRRKISPKWRNERCFSGKRD